MLAADMGPCQVEIFPEKFPQVLPNFDIPTVSFAVNGYGYFLFASHEFRIPTVILDRTIVQNRLVNAQSQSRISCTNHSVGISLPIPCSFARRYTIPPTEAN